MTPEETERNRAAATEMYGAAKSGDVEKFFSFISPDIEVEEPPFLPYGGTYEGIEGLQRLFGILASEFDLSGLEFEKIVADGDYLCVIGRAPLSGGRGTVEFIERVRMKDAKAVHLRIYIYEPSALLDVA